MLLEGQVRVGLQMPRQPLPQCLALNRWSAGDLHRPDIPRLTPSVEPALDGGAGDPKELCDLPPRYAAVYCGERLQSEVLRIGVHGPVVVQVRYLCKPL